MSRHFTVYGMPDCAGCEQSKNVLTARGESFNYVDIVAENYSQKRLMQEIGVSARSMPQIIVRDSPDAETFSHLGGVDGLRKFLIL